MRRAGLCLMALGFCAALMSGQSSARDRVDPGFERTTEFRPMWSFSTEEEQSIPLVGDGADAVHIPFAKIWPAESVILDEAALDQRDSELVPAGTTMLVLEGFNTIACEMLRPAGHENFVCLVDVGRDGSFDFYIKTGALFEYLFAPVRLNPNRARALADATAYSEVGEWADEDKISMVAGSYLDNDDVFFGARAGLSFCIERSGLTNMWGAGASATNCLTAGTRVEVDELPYVSVILGNLVALRQAETGEVFLETRPLVETGTTSFN